MLAPSAAGKRSEAARHMAAAAPPEEVKEDAFPKPMPKRTPDNSVGPAMAGIRTEQQLKEFLQSSKPLTAVVEYGTSWCHKCHEMFPTFYALSKQFNQHKYAVAQVETMQETVHTIKYTPTFAVYRDGRKVDEVIGKEPQKLADHLWLHTD